MRTHAPLGLSPVLTRIAPKPPDASICELTPAEQRQIEDVRGYSNESAPDITMTLQVAEVDVLHTDVSLIVGGRLLLGRDHAAAPGVLHIDYLRLAKSMLGDAWQPMVDAALLVY